METLLSAASPRKKRRLIKKYLPKFDGVEKRVFGNVRDLKMLAGSFYLPKEDDLKPLGEDAHFICDEKQTIGVADGVGGYAKKGIDSGIYARELMDNAVSLIEDQPNAAVDPKKVLNEAFLNTESKGASTACIVTLRQKFLYAANLGDSGFMVIRDGKIVYQSPVQQTRFNCPYQLGPATGFFLKLAQEIVFEVEQGDVLVAATDGLFDNVFHAEIEDIVTLCLKQEKSPELTAWTLGKIARQQSLREYSISPFTKAAMDDGRDLNDYLGGKPDDITVIVGYIL